jgi:RNA polymerase sigma-70 factor (ECF subfamily)
MRAIEELSVEETADTLSISANTVRSRHFRARGMLRESLAKEIDLAEGDIFGFGGPHCDRIVAGVLARIASPEAPG